MSANIESVKDRIRKLLNLAENDGASQGEIDNAVRFAQKLMQEHHLSEDDCRGDGHAAAAVAERVEMACEAAYTSSVRASSWEGTLAVFVAELVGGIGVYKGRPEPAKSAVGLVQFGPNGYPVERTPMRFYGEAEGVRLAQQLYADLAATIAAMARLKFGGALQGAGRSYGDGFVAGMYHTLQQARKAAEESEAGSALALRCTAIVAAKKQAAREWLEGNGVKLGKGRGGNGEHHSAAYGAGKADGRQANVAAKRSAKLAGVGSRRMLPGS